MLWCMISREQNSFTRQCAFQRPHPYLVTVTLGMALLAGKVSVHMWSSGATFEPLLAVWARPRLGSSHPDQLFYPDVVDRSGRLLVLEHLDALGNRCVLYRVRNYGGAYRRVVPCFVTLQLRVDLLLDAAVDLRFFFHDYCLFRDRLRFPTMGNIGNWVHICKLYLFP